ncbi:MAG: sialate O-acetylesterase [Planctomycetota bacterium]|nr:sialate O-acetylesterase [Planctomycetota bacterium]
MAIRFPRLAIAWVLPVCIATAAEEPRPSGDRTGAMVWIVSGQSNATGQGEAPGLPADPLVKTFDEKAGAWVPAGDPLPFSPAEGKWSRQSRGIGPWRTAAQMVTGATGKEIHLVGSTLNGTSIATWDDGQPGWALLSGVLGKHGKDAEIFLWYQGESDGINRTPPDVYLSKLKALVERVRQTARKPEMPVVVVQIGAVGAEGTMDPIREAQRRFVMEDGRALLVPALGRKMKDQYHLSRDGCLELGREIGRALLKTRYGRKDEDWPGPVMDAAVLSADGRTVTAHFAEARQLSGCLAADFCVLKDGKAVPCAGAEAAGTLVTLTFAVPVRLPAKVAYAQGCAPRAALVDEAGNRAPAVQLELVHGPPPADRFTIAPNGAGPGSAGTK